MLAAAAQLCMLVAAPVHGQGQDAPAVSPPPAQTPAPAPLRTPRAFRQWLDQVVLPRALARGVSRRLFCRALCGITPARDLPGPGQGASRGGAAARQPQAEFRAPAAYFPPERLQRAARLGRTMARRHRRALQEGARATGVPARIVLAIWARESDFGRARVSRNVFRVLATRAYAGGGSGPLDELLAALEIAQTRHLAPEQMKSNRAGALGQPQFMPSSYLRHAADGDGDGRADIWGSPADTIASIARYVGAHGWQAGRDWGYEVRLPRGLSCTLEGPDRPRPLKAWQAAGVRRVSGRAFPSVERGRKLSLLLPAGRLGPAFLVTPNFQVLKAYDNSDLYALYVGNLADRIGHGMGDFAGRWRLARMPGRAQILAIQRRLVALGHDVGGVDGLVGYKTRRAIGRWQEATGQRATCFPESGMAERLARGR